MAIVKTGTHTYVFKHNKDFLYFYTKLELKIEVANGEPVVLVEPKPVAPEESINTEWWDHAKTAAQALLDRYSLPYNMQITLTGIEGVMTDTPASAVGTAVFAAVFDFLKEPLSDKDIEELKAFIEVQWERFSFVGQVPNYGAIELSKEKKAMPSIGQSEKCDLSVQKVHFYWDQTENHGKVDLTEALRAFDTFPWNAQLKEMESREMSSSIPTIVFEREGGRGLYISKRDTRYFEVLYKNKYQEAFGVVSLEIDILPQLTSIDQLFEQHFSRPCFLEEGSHSIIGSNVPDLIELFFSGKIEDELLLEPKTYLDVSAGKSSKKDIHEYHGMSPGFLTTGVVLTIMAILLFAAIMISTGRFYWSLVSILFFMAFLSTRNALVKKSHWRASKDTTLILDVDEKTLEHKQNGVSQLFSRDDIERCFIVRARNYSEHYTCLHLKDGGKLVLSSYLISAADLLYTMKLHYSEQEVKFPIIRA